MRTLLLLACLLFTTNVFTQSLQLLKKIGQGEPNTVTALGQTFEGGLTQDGKLIFTASPDGFKYQIWETDGTPAGTRKINDAPETFFGSPWGEKYFIKEGAIMEEGDNVVFYSQGNKTILAEVGNDEWAGYVEVNGAYYFIVDGDGAEVWKTDLTSAGTEKLGTFNLSYSGFKAYTANQNFALFSDDITELLDYSTGTVQDLRDYLMPYQEFEEIKYAYTHDNFIFLGDGNFNEYVFNIEEKTIHPFVFIRQPKDYVLRGDDLYILTGFDIVKLNTITMEYEEIFDDVFPFTPFHFNEDNLYVVGSNFSVDPSLFEINLTTGTTRLLPGSEIGEINYNCRIKHYKGDMYYTVDDGLSQYLYRYDFDNSAPVLIDTIAVENGAYTIIHGLELVGDQLIVSKWTQALGHELYYFDETSSLQPFKRNTDIAVYPTVAQSTINLELDASHFAGQLIKIYNDSGQLASSTRLNNPRLDVSHLSSGSYFGVITLNEDDTRTFRFIKK